MNGFKILQSSYPFPNVSSGEDKNLPVNPVILHVEILASIQVSTLAFVNVNIQVEQKP